MGLFFSRQFDPAFGLDLSDLSVKAVAIKADHDSDRVTSFGSLGLPMGAIVDGEIRDTEIVRSAIVDLLGRVGPKKITSKNVICSLPETKEFLRILIIPKMKVEDVGEAIKWEIEANIPLTLEQVYYDWQILDENFTADEGKMSVLVIVVSRDVVDQFVDLLESCGLRVLGLETESVAQARALLSEKNKTETTLIVDMGDRRTSFLVTLGHVPCFTSSVPLSSQMISDAVSKKLQIPFDEADKMKIEQGLGSLAVKSPIFEAAEPILENIVSEIERTIDFFSTNLRYSENVDRIILCGGGSNLQGLVAYMTKRLGRAVEAGDPWAATRLGGELPVIPKEKSISYSTAIGLALKGQHIYEDIS
jgi:type IV pilus assembly protein PilM